MNNKQLFYIRTLSRLKLRNFIFAFTNETAFSGRDVTVNYSQWLTKSYFDFMLRDKQKYALSLLTDYELTFPQALQ